MYRVTSSRVLCLSVHFEITYEPNHPAQVLRSITVPFPGLAQCIFPTHARNNVKGVFIEVTVKRRLRMF